MRAGVSGKRKKRLFDLMLILALVVLSLSVFLFTELTRGVGEYVAVTVDGERVAEYPLYTDGEYSLNGGTNILVIEGGKAYIKSATCPDKTCVTVGGRICRGGERIICLPNSLIVEICGGEDSFVSPGVILCR